MKIKSYQTTATLALLLNAPIAMAGAPALPKVLPVLTQAIPDITTQANTANVSYDLTARFGTEEIDPDVVRFTSQTSNGSRVMDFAMFSTATPITRANFLQYVNDGDYDRSIIHRSIPGFVIQGGGFFVPSTGLAWPPSTIPADPAIINEFGISNTFGTVSMAKQGGNPNSATNSWFISLGDNAASNNPLNLDNQNGGFTVFARVTKDTVSNASDFGNPSLFRILNAGGALSNIPFNAAFANLALPLETDYIMFTTAALAPLPAGQAGESTLLTYSIAGNTNPAVSASIDAMNQLQIGYLTDSWGRGVVSVRATDSVGNAVDDNFTIEVQRTYDLWRSSVFSVADAADDNVSGPNVSNGAALTNLELYAHGLTPADRDEDVVAFSNTTIIFSDYPTFSFPMFNLASGVTFAIQESTDLGLTDNWETVPHTVITQSRSGNIDSMVIRSSSPRASTNTFYRLIFTLTE